MHEYAGLMKSATTIFTATCLVLGLLWSSRSQKRTLACKQGPDFVRLCQNSALACAVILIFLSFSKSPRFLLSEGAVNFLNIPLPAYCRCGLCSVTRSVCHSPHLCFIWSFFYSFDKSFYCLSPRTFVIFSSCQTVCSFSV